MQLAKPEESFTAQQLQAWDAIANKGKPERFFKKYLSMDGSHYVYESLNQ